MGRNNLIMMEGLLKCLVYVKFDPEVKVRLDACNVVDSKLWTRYCTYQAEFKDRVSVLRSEKRDIPEEEDGDKIMPSILHTWTGKFRDIQPQKNYHAKTSCAFDKSRIDEYERRNQKFTKSIETAGHQAAKEIVPLLIHDIAYLKSFDVQWMKSLLLLQERQQRMTTTNWNQTLLRGACTIPTL
jgi:hypothetical protein